MGVLPGVQVFLLDAGDVGVEVCLRPRWVRLLWGRGWFPH